MDLLKGLNEPQREAVLHTEGPLLVLAGAGSGKTRVLTHRIANMILNKGVYPGSILAITFTNKAAKEMKERIERLVGEGSDNIWVGTFHSMCVRILRKDIEKLGYDRSFVIYDTADQTTVIKDCLKQLNINDKNFPPRAVMDAIGRAKDELQEPTTFKRIHGSDFRMSKIAAIYELYQKKLKANNALDFDDIIILTIKLFMDHPPVLRFYQNKFKYVLVDEYQDTNTAQYHLVSLIAQEYQNLCVVGDEDQSIYGWRGANIQNILDFEKEFTNAKVVKLEQNYRSTKHILEAANNVIKNNLGRKGKKLWTGNDDGSKITLKQSDNEHGEALFIAWEIQKQIREVDRKFNDFAVLYRINAQSRVLEEKLISNGIPYRIIGGLKFYDRKEIKDIIAYLRVIQNPADNISLKRIINVPKRGIGDSTVEKAEEAANSKEISIFSIISNAVDEPSLQRAVVKLDVFTTLIAKLRVLKEHMTISDLILTVATDTGMLRELEAENTDEAKTRIENIKELISKGSEFENDPNREEKNLEAFLANVSLVADIDTLGEERDFVTLMTLHSAKGLEFPVVFLAGMEEGVFPGFRTMTDENELEEERRLCYVGITRAMEKLYISHCSIRTLFNNTTCNSLSRFIKEIPQNLIDNGFQPNGIQARTGSYVNLQQSPKPITNNVTKGFPGFKPASEYISKASSGESFSIGERVSHKKFGNGTITLSVKEGEDIKLEINFDGIGMKRLMASFANLKKI
jgi:DNA helicase-2/ATP-dependent DNA helicase PcrA